MKKKVLAAALCASMTLAFTGCSSELSNEYVTVKQYKGLEVPEVEKTEVTDEDVENAVATNMMYYQEEVDIADRAAELGDYVEMDYVGSVDGVEFEGGTASGAVLELGSGSYIGANGDYEGFEDQIVGHNVGDEFDITVKFPDNYSEELSGQVANFHITLNRIYTVVEPELTDEWVAEVSEESETVDEYKEEVREDLEESNEQTWMSSMQSGIITALTEQVEVTSELPAEDVEEARASYEEYYTTMASYYGMEYADYVTNYIGTTEEEFAERILTAAEQNVALEMAIELIAEKEGLAVTDEQYAEKIEELAVTYGFATSDEFVEYYGEEDVRKSITQENVFEFLIDNCIQVEAE